MIYFVCYPVKVNNNGLSKFNKSYGCYTINGN